MARPRNDGERYPCGALKTADRRPGRVPAELTFVQAEALRRYGQDAEGAEALTDPMKRLDAIASIRSARGALSQQARAIIELTVVRGWSLSGLANQTGESADLLLQRLKSAADDLATHYEVRDAN